MYWQDHLNSPADMNQKPDGFIIDLILSMQDHGR